MSATESIESGIAMPCLGFVQAVGTSCLQVAWAEGARAGRSETLDLAPLIGSYRIYRPLRANAALFATARLIEDGDVVARAGENLEMTAEMIGHLAAQDMTPEDFASFLQRNNLTQAAAGAVLGRSRRQIGYYLEKGPVPRVVALACAGWEGMVRREWNWTIAD